MISMDEKITIKTLYESGKSNRHIAKLLGKSRDTINKYVSILKTGGNKELTTIQKRERKSVVEPYKSVILAWLDKEPTLSALRIWEKLRDEENFNYKYDSVKRFVSKLKSTKQAYPLLSHFDPAKEAQVDFGYVGFVYDPNTRKRRKAYVFCMRLSYSRYDFYKVVFDQKVSTFLILHEEAFKYFDGVPHTIKIDNLKAAVLEANFYNPTYQTEYLKFSVHYNFSPDPCKVYHAKGKALVENGIKFVKYNFFAGRSFKDIDDCNRKLQDWMKDKAQRIHGTIKRKPFEVFQLEEKKKLRQLPFEVYELYEWSENRLHPDCYLRVDKSFYSAPFNYIGEKLFVRKSRNFVEIYNSKLEKICTHPKSQKCGSQIKEDSHFPEWITLVTTNRYKYTLKQAEKYGDIVRNYCEQIFQLHSSSAYRMIQGIVSLGKRHGIKRLEDACLRASQYENYSYMCIKNILTKNLIPLENILDIEDFRHKEAVNTYKSDLSNYDKLI